MAPQRFDTLVRALGTSSRRHVVRLLAGGSLGGLLTRLGPERASATHTGCGHNGAGCTRPGQCCTGRCAGNGTCQRCTSASQCPSPPASQPCKKRICTSTGKCVIGNKRADAACPDDGDPCTKNVCDGSGICIHPKQADGTLCAGGTCQDGDCDPCGRLDQACCDGPVECAAGGLCFNDPSPVIGESCVPCGNLDERCCINSPCVEGTVCYFGFCEACGKHGQPCCFADPACAPGTRCVTDLFGESICQNCGDADQPCCEPNFCAELECNRRGYCTACGARNEECCIDNTCDPELRCEIDCFEELCSGTCINA